MDRFYLLGFMGSGKSSIGKQFAQGMNYDFVDLDDFIVENEGISIPTIFTLKGETHFRKLERKYLKLAGEKKKVVIATGGGTPCFNNNISWINRQGECIYLKASNALLLKRLYGKEQEKRPLIKDLNKTQLSKLIREKIATRKVFYEQANFTLYQRINSINCAEKLLKQYC